jgi:hypothetical protein
MKQNTLTVIFFALVAISTPVYAKGPNCSGADNWATTMAFVHLKNAGLTNNDQLDFTQTKTTLLASERIGKDLYRQIHRVLFTEKSGNKIEVITSNNASTEECSMSGVEIFVVSKHLGGL